jgi:S-adenosylmethionine:tRNA ribosyltransferase-isomerase
VNGLLTGMHSPEESHYELLGAFLTPQLLQASHQKARELGFVRHEFGDACLILDARLAVSGSAPRLTQHPAA